MRQGKGAGGWPFMGWMQQCQHRLSGWLRCGVEAGQVACRGWICLEKPREQAGRAGAVALAAGRGACYSGHLPEAQCKPSQAGFTG